MSEQTNPEENDLQESVSSVNLNSDDASSFAAPQAPNDTEEEEEVHVNDDNLEEENENVQQQENTIEHEEEQQPKLEEPIVSHDDENNKNEVNSISNNEGQEVPEVHQKVEEAIDQHDTETIDHTQLTSNHVRNISTTSTTIASNAKSTLLLVKTTLEELVEEKEVKKIPGTHKIIQRTITKIEDTLKESNGSSIEVNSILLFEALRAASRTKSSRITSKALDTLSKLFSFRAIDEAILVNPPDSMASNDQETTNDNSGITPPPKQRLIDAAIDTIADCFEGEGTDERVELQIIRSLSGCILVEDANSLCHGASLLKAIRTIYNIFVFSLNPTNQGIAQTTLTQIISAVYDKIEVKKIQPYQVSINESKKSLPTSEVTGNDPITLQNMENLNDEEERRMDAQQYDDATDDEQLDKDASERELAIKDAFLVFRAMSKICAKPLESELDMRSHAVRSKLLSLHIIYSIIKDHIDIFLSPDIILPGKESVSLMNAVRQYLCLSLSRNAASPIPPVFEITLEIMWLIVANLRADMVKEIPVFLTEIYFPITELKTATSQQKRYFLTVIQRICNDPRTLIEFYLNYDCNPGMPNIMEIMVDYLTKLALTRVEITPSQRSYYEEQLSKPLSTFNFNELPLLTTSTLPSNIDPNQGALLFPIDFALKMTSLNCIISILRSLGSWAHKALNPNSNIVNPAKGSNQLGQSVDGTNTNTSLTLGDENSASESNVNINVSQDVDDPTQFENLKQRKTQLSDSVAIFNNKPKKAIPGLISRGFIIDDSPSSIAKWLLETDGLDLAVVGDYLGEGNEKNIAVMHAFVEQFDFKGLSIVDALRDFLQAFRLPGEGQKIDRFMLKFAERYVEQNPGVFSKADTAYVLSYSLIMLNTDLHSSQIKSKMTLEEFLDNNKGIDNDHDLPEEFLVGLFKEIEGNEIKLLSEQHQAMLSEDNTATIGTIPAQAAFNFFSSRDLARESYLQVSKEISSKTELVFKNLSKSKGKQDTEVYYAASHFEHVKSIFETLWMSFLAALTPPFKDYDDIETTNKCLDGLKISIKISSIFVLDDARKSFIGALVQFCNLQNVQEIKVKNVNAMIDLLEIALAEGNYLKDSWKDVILVVSQMERLQLISKGIDRDTVPDVAQARFANPRASLESTRSANQSIFDIWGKKATPMELAQEKHHNQKLSSEMSKFISSSDLVVLMDNIFTKSSELSGSAIIDFIKALTAVSLDEIESSQYASTPRMFSLQKMIDVCYYNMDRIRLEWTPLWAVMGNAFNKIATNPNLAIVFFAIDSLRQLSMRFLDIDELSGFEFQSDFLKPFEYAVQNTTNTEVQEMIIECFGNFILTKQQHIKSGWKPILESLQYTAASKDEKIVLKTLRLVGDDIVDKNFESVFGQDGAFFELVGIFKEITKNKKYQKAALHALESLKRITEQIAKICFSHDDLDAETREHYEQLLRGKDVFQDVWFPMLYCFNETIMTADDLEVRSRALNYMFDSLVAYGGEFDDAFWEKICTKLLFPIFGVLSKHWEVNQFNSHDELSVWLSTTLIQALRNLIALFTHYFESLSGLLDGFLDLLVSCICQENDTIARIGRSCLQELILQNVDKFNETNWQHIGEVFTKLFRLTTANELFDNDPLRQGRRSSIVDNTLPDSNTTPSTNNNEGTQETVERAHVEAGSEDVGGETAEQDQEHQEIQKTEVQKVEQPEDDTHDTRRRRINIKNSIVVKCVLQLLMIELLNELYEDENFARCIPYTESIRLTELLEQSYGFARDFNADYGLRTRLVEARVVDKIPNLLKQETSAAAVLIDIMFKLYFNGNNSDNDDDDTKNIELLDRLVRICSRVMSAYIALDDRTMERSINSWRPVIVEILQGYYELDDDDFRHHCASMYTLVIEILDKSVPQDLRYAIKLFLGRVGTLYLEASK
ncbi:similar to Saccharomyces cerevisiae YDR170C SEC7 Guanine nucleotide exchange factor (GEF) for ADP ribosylation factors involved in proliferation of the Golgi [Maudiozyma barnettii]|uniref:Similar to Saccharomyces cerevisiae YDR170C SEC7 Guanine nucleotide exchange factor (GEF) for ADP ribosylation factors involved in proliferation of the Golgi n=1 Tax=Maudiozyma barnettii TaxID=61262 RepID=A0A8H2VI45_9SACH|nr:Arf family guanine nucleotide exchange factor SEC7 [Kazachstania barnettii]CAB4255659.1 similar to Saccharomyces cerevisiae YDR170C SEC7 Guanine nucleotide exchange factor (GEF) for ADP ribosylation factors involved in proliferation of the Golgi [Kazachstania barnettii]CAD1784220.1 similar to Saccharomyces cerevisiae YDR170C SEC7 Guanine nucleotide exchange factor (GEF) for ADP ribosylation factors involved in proliferation of the Golgi [Kazachstania barnettii]